MKDHNHSQYIGPGLVDLQINGFRGVDFNSSDLTEIKLHETMKKLRAEGVVKFFPTLITSSSDFLFSQLKLIHSCCLNSRELSRAIAGIHLEGPFISKKDGAIGAHPKEWTALPSIEWLNRVVDYSGGMVKLITLAPELPGAHDFIRKCSDQHIITAMGHSLAQKEDIDKAVDCGMTLSTHLGNALPLELNKFENPLFDQICKDELACSLIYDGHHLSLSLAKIITKIKSDKAFLVSDATAFAGLNPGIYDTPIGGKVELNAEGRLSIYKNTMLAGSSKSLKQCVLKVIADQLLDVDSAWEAASLRPANFIGIKPSELDIVTINY